MRRSRRQLLAEAGTPDGEPFDAILLDIDNGPEAFTVRGNERLHRPPGLAALLAALRPGAVAMLWSAFPSRSFVQRLRRAGFHARSMPVRARAQLGKGARHTLFVATRPPLEDMRDASPRERG